MAILSKLSSPLGNLFSIIVLTLAISSNNNKLIQHYNLHVLISVFTKITHNYNHKLDTIIYLPPAYVSLIVNVVSLFLQIELNPVMETNHFSAIAGFTNKHVFKPRGIQHRRPSSSEKHKNNNHRGGLVLVQWYV